MKDPETLREELRQLMESQRDNTRIAYGWLSNVILILSSGLFFFGLNTDETEKFVPAMSLGVVLALVWMGITEVFAAHIRKRFERLKEISDDLGIKSYPDLEPTFIDKSLSRALGKLPGVHNVLRHFPLTQIRTYVLVFVIAYILVWLLRLAFILT